MPLYSDIVGIEPVEGDVWKMIRAMTNENCQARLGLLGCSRNLHRSTSGCDLTHQVLENDSQNDCQPKPAQQQTSLYFANRPKVSVQKTPVPQAPIVQPSETRPQASYAM